MNLDSHLKTLGIDARLVQEHLIASDLTLSFKDGVLFLVDLNNPKITATANFLNKKLIHRSSQHINKELLVKACRIKGQVHFNLLDATCGFGKDAFLLSCAGFKVVACEVNPVVFTLLHNALNHYQNQLNNRPRPFTLYFDDAFNMIKWQKYDIIYLDPMFPPRNKDALVKKDMQLFHRLHKKTMNDVGSLLNHALQCAKYRVVIKRPAKSPVLNSHKLTFQITGKSCRFDVYHL